MQFFKPGAVLFLTLALASCTYPLTDYRKAQPRVAAAGPGAGTIAIAGVDGRSYLAKGEIQANYVGLLRDGMGVPYHVNTVNQRPAVEHLAEALERGYYAAGYAATVIRYEKVMNRADAIQALEQSGAQRYLLLTAQELDADMLFHADILYNLRLEVLDRPGKTLATSEVKAHKEIGDWAIPRHHAQHTLHPAMAAALTTLVNDGSVQAALR